jgi:hypothetical protein
MSDEFLLIKTAVFPAVTDVRFYEETLQHIIEQHPEVPILLPSVNSAVEHGLILPTHIEASYSNSFVFVDAETTNAVGDPLRIPVKIIEGTSARLKTVYFASADQDNQNIVWRRS